MTAQKVGFRSTPYGDVTVKWTGNTADHEDIQNIPPNPTGTSWVLQPQFLEFDGDSMTYAGGWGGAFALQPHAGIAQITSWTWDGPFVVGGRRLLPMGVGDLPPGALATPAVWNPGLRPAGTVLASGVNMNVGTVSALVDWQVKVSATQTPITCTVDPRTMPLLEVSFTRKDANALLSSNVVMDALDDEGNWWIVDTFMPSTALNALVLAPQRTVNPYVTWVDGASVTQTMAMNPTKFSFRLATDPLGSATLGTSDILYLIPDGLDTTLDTLVNVGFDVSVDVFSPGSVQTTATPTSTSGPAIGVSGGPNYWVSVDPGGLTVTLHNGDSTIGTYPLPAGYVNGPLTLRLDHGVLSLIYNGVVLFLYRLPLADWSALSVSTQYVGIWSSTSHSLTSTATPVYPPLGGWLYLLMAWFHEPIGIRPRLWKVWANILQSGLSWFYSPTLGTAWSEQLPSQEETEALDSWFYRGGVEHLVPVEVAQAIANAGGISYLTAVV